MQGDVGVSYQLPLCSGCKEALAVLFVTGTNLSFAVPILYLHVHVDSFQLVLFSVLWFLLYSLAFCSEGGEVCGEVCVGEKGTLVLRPEVRKTPISPLWDSQSHIVAVPLEVSLFSKK